MTRRSLSEHLSGLGVKSGIEGQRSMAEVLEAVPLGATWGERKDRVLGLEHASYNYVSKPFQLEDLLVKIREVLQQQSVTS